MCEKFSKAIDSGTVITNGLTYSIHGVPDVWDNGYDNTPEVKITHCPFCGDKLRGEEDDNGIHNEE